MGPEECLLTVEMPEGAEWNSENPLKLPRAIPPMPHGPVVRSILCRSHEA
jgi:hypothetical protein